MDTRKKFDTRKVIDALELLGFIPTGSATGGHHLFERKSDGSKCQAVIRKRDISIIAVSALGNELERKGICQRREFMRSVRGY
jgi:hypothetical protein